MYIHCMYFERPLDINMYARFICSKHCVNIVLFVLYLLRVNILHDSDPYTYVYRYIHICMCVGIQIRVRVYVYRYFFDAEEKFIF